MNLCILENTVVVVMGDHLAFRDIFGSLNKRDKRNIYFKINSNKKIKRSKMNHFDVAPTILDALNILPEDNKQFGFGISLFQDENKFNYDKHYNLVMRPDILSNFYLRRLLKFVPPAKTDGKGWVRFDPTQVIPQINIVSFNNVSSNSMQDKDIEKNNLFLKPNMIKLYYDYFDYIWTNKFQDYNQKSRDELLKNRLFFSISLSCIPLEDTLLKLTILI